jgi:hypothetical protein
MKKHLKITVSLSIFLALSMPSLGIAQALEQEKPSISLQLRSRLDALRKGFVAHKRTIVTGAGTVGAALALLVGGIVYREGGVLNTAAKYNIKPVFKAMAKQDPREALVAAALYKNKQLIETAEEIWTQGEGRRHHSDLSEMHKTLTLYDGYKALRAFFCPQYRRHELALVSRGSNYPALQFYMAAKNGDVETLKTAFKLGFRLDYWTLDSLNSLLKIGIPVYMRWV